jgi:predicted transcriptional regulator of viral defense system
MRDVFRPAGARAFTLFIAPFRRIHSQVIELGSEMGVGLQYVGPCVYTPTFSKNLMTNPRIAQLVNIVRRVGILRPRDLHSHGIPRVYLRMALDQGAIVRVGRGLYVPRGAKPTEHHSFAQASKRVPRGVVCLLSALRFHNFTTQSPFEVWLAIEEKSRLPRFENPPLRIVRFSGKALTYGVQEHRIEGVSVNIFSPAKTVADCFRYRHKIGLDVALEALRECIRERKATRDEIWKSGRICRVANVMRPYLESLS